MNQIRFRTLLALAFALLPALTSLATGVQESGTTDEPVTFTLTMNSDPDSLDPHRSSASITEQVMLNVFDGLVNPTPDGGVEPAIAESYSISPDGLTYTFRLRDNVYFHNGDEVTVDDLTYTFERLQELSSEFADVVELDAPDARTFVITLSQPNSSFEKFLYRAVIPAGYDDHANQPIGAGPYRFVEYIPQNRIVLERNERYYKPVGDVDRVVIRIIGDADARLLALRSGEVDFTGVSTQRVDEVADSFEVIAAQANSVFIFGMNNEHEALSDVRVRQAVNYALDRDEIIDFVFNGYAVELVSSMSPAMAEFFDASLLGRYDTNLTRARQLLAEAGYADGFPITLRISGHSEIYSDTAQVIQQQLAPVGIDVTIEVIEWSMWLSDIYTERNFETTLIDFTGKLDPYPVLRRYISDYRRNFLNFDSAQYDRIMESALRSPDAERRVELYKEAQSLLADQVPAAFLADYQFTWAMDPKFDGYTPYPFFFHDISRIVAAQ
jgi:peptide/nickel transport system substrate-binding protein